MAKPNPTKRVAIYARVSTDGQTTDNQVIELRAIAQRHNWKIDVGLYLHQQAVDTTTPAGRALFQMMGVFAEFERSMIQERVKAGLQRARRQGRTLGRPLGGPGQPKRLSGKPEVPARAWCMQIVRQLGVGVSVVQRVVQDAQRVPL